MLKEPQIPSRKLLALMLSAALAAFLISGCASKSITTAKRPGTGSRTNDPTQVPYVIKGVTYYPIPDATGFKEKGVASWYGDYFHGRPTSNGERYDMYGMTAAHKILPMNTMLRVRNLDNGKETVVRVNDRGPFVDGRIIDLSYTAAQQLDVVGPGTSRVEIIALSQDASYSSPTPAAASAPKAPQTKIQARRQPQKQPDKEYYVQVGSFSQQENALRLRKRFADAGHTAVIKQESEAAQPRYQVYVFAGREFMVAKKAEEQLLAHGYSGAYLVAR